MIVGRQSLSNSGSNTLYLPFYLPNIFVIISYADCLQCCPSLVLSQCQVFVSILDHVTCKFVAWSTIYPNTLNPKRTPGSLIFQTELLILREQRCLETHMLYNSHIFDGADSFNWTLYIEKSVVYCNVCMMIDFWLHDA